MSEAINLAEINAIDVMAYANIERNFNNLRTVIETRRAAAKRLTASRPMLSAQERIDTVRQLNRCNEVISEHLGILKIEE